jgi:hypothetical protein
MCEPTTIPNNKPDIITCESARATCMLVDVEVLGDRNVIRKEAEKIIKYKDLNNINTVHVACKNNRETTNSHKKKPTNSHILLTPFLLSVTPTCCCCTT